MSDRMISAMAGLFYVTAGLAVACHLVVLGGLVAFALGVGR